MRAQFWSFDVIFAMVIFGTTLVLLTFAWSSMSGQLSSTYGLGLQSMQEQLQSLQSRILAPGTPNDWASQVNISNTGTWSNMSIGLGTGSGSQLSLPKIYTLAAMTNHNSTSYQATKQLIGVGYDYYITVKTANVTLAMGSYPFNKDPYAIQTATKSAILNGLPATVQIMVWTNKSFGVS